MPERAVLCRQVPDRLRYLSVLITQRPQVQILSPLPCDLSGDREILESKP